MALQLSDLFFWRNAVNRTGLPNITGDELAALIAATIPPSVGSVGLGTSLILDGSINFPDGSVGVIDWSNAGGPTIEYDELNMYDPGSPDRITIPAGVSRVIQFLKCQWANNSTGRRGLFSGRSGSTQFPGAIQITENAVTGATHNMSATSGPITVTEGTFLRMRPLQTSGGALNISQVQMIVYLLRE